MCDEEKTHRHLYHLKKQMKMSFVSQGKFWRHTWLLVPMALCSFWMILCHPCLHIMHPLKIGIVEWTPQQAAVLSGVAFTYTVIEHLVMRSFPAWTTFCFHHCSTWDFKGVGTQGRPWHMPQFWLCFETVGASASWCSQMALPVCLAYWLTCLYFLSPNSTHRFPTCLSCFILTLLHFRIILIKPKYGMSFFFFFLFPQCMFTLLNLKLIKKWVIIHSIV